MIAHLALRGGHDLGPAHTQSLSQRPAFTATPLQATKPLINYHELLGLQPFFVLSEDFIESALLTLGDNVSLHGI